MTPVSLPRVIVEPIVRNALAEDLGLAGDITSAAVIPGDHRSTVVMAARQPGVIAGLDAAELAFQLVDPAITFFTARLDGSPYRVDDWQRKGLLGAASPRLWDEMAEKLSALSD